MLIIFCLCSQYSEKRFTESLKAVYFVMSDFTKKYNRAAVLRLEQEIEGVYVSNLRRECFQERATSEFIFLKHYTSSLLLQGVLL